MAILNNKTHISSEIDEKVITDVTLNNGVLTFTRKDFYNNPDVLNPEDNSYDEKIVWDLKKIKLRYKKVDEEYLERLANTTDEDKIIERETHIFLTLIPSSESGEEGIYREHLWVENGNQSGFEVLGSTRLDLEQYIKKTKVKDNLTEDSEFNSDDPLVLSAQQGKTLQDTKAPNNHASTATTYGVSTTTEYGHSKTYNSTPEDISLDSGNKGTKTTEFAMGDHKHKHPDGAAGAALNGKPENDTSPEFGGTIIISQVKTNKTGHVDSLTDKTITIPSNLGNGNKVGLSTYDYDANDKTKVTNMENTIWAQIGDSFDYLYEKLSE